MPKILLVEDNEMNRGFVDGGRGRSDSNREPSLDCSEPLARSVESGSGTLRSSSMEWRRFLRVLARGIAGGALLGDSITAWAQDSASPKNGAATRYPGEDPTVTAPGVTPGAIKIGMSATFKGTAAGLGTELYRGPKPTTTR
jgi:hypothetical protein